MTKLFDIPAFFIVLREVLEACLVVGIALAYLNRTGATQYRKWVWIGAGVGIGISIIIGLVFGLIFWINDNSVFEGNAEKIFEGVTFLVAAALLTWMIVWMMAMGRQIQEKLEGKVEKIMENDKSSRRRAFGLASLVGFQVLREGIETFIFISANGSADDRGGWRAIPIPGVLAIFVGLLVSYLVFKGMMQLDIIRFFYVSGILLVAFAAGLVSYAFHEIQETGAFGPWADDKSQRDWYNYSFWTTKACCNDKSNEFFAIFRALFGYQDTPTFIEWSTYFAYWLLFCVLVIGLNWDVVRASKDEISRYAKMFSGLSVVISLVGFIYTLINRSAVGTTTMTLSLVLSCLSIFFVFDPLFNYLKALKSVRRTMSMAIGVLWVGLLIAMFTLHIVELECIGKEDVDECDMDYFFFFGLIFNGNYNSRQRESEPLGWPSVASLSMSIVVTTFFFGGLAFFYIMNSLNITSDGSRLTNDHVELSSEGDELEKGERYVYEAHDEEDKVEKIVRQEGHVNHAPVM